MWLRKINDEIILALKFYELVEVGWGMAGNLEITFLKMRRLRVLVDALHFVKHGFEAYKDFSLIDVVKFNILIGALTIYGRCFAKAGGRKVKFEP